MLQRYKRLLAGVMTVAMIFSILPMQVYAAWWEDKDQNKVILQELTEFWKDEKTAQEAMELLRKYGLIDEDGNVLTDWSKDMYIQEESRSLTIAQVRAMEEGIVTVHDRSCDAAGLNAVLNRMEALGLLVNDAPVTDWKLQADGEAVSPAYLAAAQSASAVTVLGKTVDSAELLAVIEFLSQYGLLTETGAAEDWDLTLPGGSRPTNVTELLQLLEDKKDKKVDPDILITVDGTPITLSDFEIMMQIETEVKRIRETYFQDEVDMTQAQLSSLYSLYEQLSVNGIQLYNTYAADNLVFPSKIDQRVRLTMEVDSSTPLPVTANNGTVKLNFTLDRTVEHEVSFRVRTLDGSAKAGVQYEAFDKTVTIDAGKQETSVTINLEAFQPSWSGTDVWSGERVFYVQASEVKGALFGEDASSAIQQISIKSNLTFPTASLNKSSGLDSTGATSVTVSFSDAEKYMLKNHLVSHMDFSCAPNFSYTHANGANIKPMNTYYAYQAVTVGKDDRRFSAYATMYAKLTLGGTTFVNETRGYQGGPLSALGLLSQTAREWYDAEGKGQASQYAIADGKQYLSLTSGISPTDTISAITKNDIDISALDVSTGLSVSSYGTVTGAYVVYWSFPDDDFYNVNIANPGSQINTSTKLTFKDKTAPTYVANSISAPAGNYEPGDSIPISVQFSEPVKASTAKLTVNETEVLSARESGSTYSTVLTFLYEVKTGGNTFVKANKITGAQDLYGNTIKDVTLNVELCKGMLSNARLLDAVDNNPDISAGPLTFIPSPDGLTDKTVAQVSVTLKIPPESEKDLRDKIYDTYQDPATSAICNSLLAASMDGGETLVPLVIQNPTAQNPSLMTATVEVDAAELVGFAGDARDFIMEFYKISVDAKNQVTKGDLVFGRYVPFSVKKPIPLTGDKLSIETPPGWPTDVIYANSPPEDAALTLRGIVTGSGYTWSQTRWASSDETIATISAGGVVHPLKSGTVSFYLEAVNGNQKEYAGQRSAPVTLEIREGAEPYLRIPESEMTIRSGDPVTLRWASNLVQKNAEYADGAATTFHIEVTGPKGYFEAYDVTYDPANQDEELWVNGSPNQSFTINGLTEVDAAGYTITLSAEADEGIPGALSEGYTATAHVTVISKPVSVKLERPEKMFVVNRGSLTVNYTLEDFDVTNGAEFKLVVTDNENGTVVYQSNATGEAGGSFPIHLSEAKTNGFRTIYDVSIWAKNAAETDWSRDSFTLYIYDAACLDILVQPVEKDRVVVDGDTVIMNNEKWISGLNQDQILALNRDIDLQTVISINYGAHLWSEAIDRLNWLSENSEIAAVNYPQGAYYENVEGLPNPSYAPASQFLLSGKNSGETVVEAIHALAGEALSSSVKVSVETLQDKLYLFQFYPATSGITMTYTNGDGVLKGANGEVVSDSQGRFAIYEPNGIDSDVYVKAELEGEVYLGTVYQEDLVSQEKDAVSLELYPLNSLTLRKVATLPVYLKKPDGSNYDGQATVRAGVYRNGVYCEQAMYTTTAGDKPLVLGTNDYKVSFDKNGKATFYYDLTQFNTSGNTDPVTAADDIQFVLELRVNGYYPILFTANGTTNEDDAIRMSERIVNLEIVPAGETEKPFVARQAVYFSGEERGIATNVRNKDGKIGPSTDYPELLLSTTVFWWGSANTDAKRTLQYIDGTGRTLTGQQQSPGEFYPFCSMPVSHSTVKLDKAQMKSLGMADYTVRTVSLQYQENDTTVKNENMRWQLINISLGSAIGSKDLMERMKNLTAMIASTSSDGVTTLKNDFLAAGISLVTATGIKLPFLKLQLHPTQDPTVFRGLAYLGLNNFEGDNVSGVDADTSRGYDLDYFPGYETIKNLYKQGASYGGTMGNQVAYAGKMLAANIRQMSGTSLTGDRKINYALQGCMETEVYYDFDDNQWKVVVVTGSLTAGGGMGYEWTWNTQVGPVPVFLQLEAGAAGALEFQAAVDRERGDNDYLTELRLYAYLQAFGGIGFDYAVLALKVGLYGRVGLDATLRWLNAIDQSAKFGAEIGMEGEIGVKLQVEVLFISYEKILWSQPIFNYSGAKGNWKEIDAYWERVKDGNSGYGAIVSPSSGRMRASLVASNADTGMGIYAADQDAALIDRDYLSEYHRSYDSSGPSLGGGISPFALFSSQENSAIRKTFRNSYPQAAPVLSDDGAYLFYLSDGNDASDATNVRAAVMLRNDDNGYEYAGGGTINADGYGDSGLRAAGSGENAVAVWSRVMEKPDITEPGQKVTPDVQSAMMASSDIMVAVQDGSGGWRVVNLTENNGMADLSPVVAAKDDHILVAWRQVASSDAVDLTRFNAKDYIMYRYSDNGGESWSEARSVYNGTSGAVKGLEAAMMPDGTAAVTFTLQTGEHDAAGGKYHQEIAYAILGQTATPGEYDVLRYVQMTDDENLDENPQIAAVSLDGGDSSIFVLGWYSLSGDSGSDIRLAAVDRAGNRITGFVDSLSSLIQNAEVGVSANFQFSKNAASLDDLSILWSDTAAEDSVSGEPTHDYLSAIRFRTTDGQRISVTAAQQIVKMDAYTAIDNFNAYVGKDKNLYAAIQGTYYDYENPKSYTVTYPDGSEREVSVAQELTSIYTVVGAYTDTLRVDSVIPDYANIRKGASLPVQISVTNLGTQPMNKVEVEIGDDQASVFQTGRGDAFVAIAPGETRSLTVYYTVPATGAIPNPGYRITGTFADGSSDSSDLETLILNIPDLGIASSDILVNAANGNRTLQFNLYNLSDAELNGSGRIVKFNLYSDPECTQAIDPQYLTLVKKPGTKSGDALLTVSGDDLDAVDKDSFTLQYEFHLSEYIKQTEESADGGTIAMFADENGEVRDGGVTVYAKAWIELPGQTEDGGGEMLEYNSSNNVASVDLVSLLKQANGKPTTVTSTLDNSGEGSVVNVILQNNSMVQKTTGNVIVTLYDAQDNVVGVQQRYRKDGVNYGLLSLDPEAIQLEKFIFDKPGVRAEVAYGNLVLDDPDNTELCHLVFSGICELADFVQAEDGNYTASVTVSQLSSTTITAMTANPDATVTVNGREVKPGEGLTQELGRGENVLVLVVTTESGASVTYTLTVQNNYPSGTGIGFAKYPVKVPAETEHGAVTVKPDRAKRGDTVTITAEPDEGYQVGSVTVLTSNGDEVAVTKKAEGVYTFVMPDCTVEVTVTFIPENRSQWINPFLDVSEDAWYYDAVRYVNEQGLMAGTSADTFSPDVTTTRGMIVTILYRLEGSPDMEDEIWGYPFADVDADAWYAAAVYWARMHGIVSGYSDELFGPDDVITREQMAAILYRYAQYKGYDTAARADLSRYTDGDQVSSWALDPILWANAEGLVNGTSDTTLSPRGSATRAQVAAILTRFCQNVVK